MEGRQAVFEKLSHQVEASIRDAYKRRRDAGEVTQISLAESLNIDASAINRRLRNGNNLRLRSIADLVWALGFDIEVRIYDPITSRSGSE